MISTVERQQVQQLLAKPDLHLAVVVRDHTSGLLYSVPYLRALRRHLPDARITLLANDYAMPILRHCPYCDEIMPFFRFRPERRLSARLERWFQRLRIWRQLVKRVDLVVHLRNVGHATLLFAAALGKPFQVGYAQGKFDHLLDLNLGREDVTRGSRQRNAVILEALGIPTSPEMELWLAQEERAWAQTFLRKHGWRGQKPLFVLHPGSHWGCNEWLPDRWSEVGNRLQERYGGKIAITGAARERQLAEQIASGMASAPIIATGETSLRQFAALLDQATLVVGVDSAATQICQALSQRTVIVMGAGNPIWHAPVEGEPMLILQSWDPADEETLYCDFAAGKCHGPYCRSRSVGVTVAEVLTAAEYLLRPSAEVKRVLEKSPSVVKAPSMLPQSTAHTLD